MKSSSCMKRNFLSVDQDILEEQTIVEALMKTVLPAWFVLDFWSNQKILSLCKSQFKVVTTNDGFTILQEPLKSMNDNFPYFSWFWVKN